MSIKRRLCVCVCESVCECVEKLRTAGGKLEAEQQPQRELHNSLTLCNLLYRLFITCVRGCVSVCVGVCVCLRSIYPDSCTINWPFSCLLQYNEKGSLPGRVAGKTARIKPTRTPWPAHAAGAGAGVRAAGAAEAEAGDPSQRPITPKQL